MGQDGHARVRGVNVGMTPTKQRGEWSGAWGPIPEVVELQEQHRWDMEIFWEEYRRESESRRQEMEALRQEVEQNRREMEATKAQLKAVIEQQRAFSKMFAKFEKKISSQFPDKKEIQPSDEFLGADLAFLDA